MSQKAGYLFLSSCWRHFAFRFSLSEPVDISATLFVEVGKHIVVQEDGWTLVLTSIKDNPEGIFGVEVNTLTL